MLPKHDSRDLAAAATDHVPRNVGPRTKARCSNDHAPETMADLRPRTNADPCLVRPNPCSCCRRGRPSRRPSWTPSVPIQTASRSILAILARRSDLAAYPNKDEEAHRTRCHRTLSYASLQRNSPAPIYHLQDGRAARTQLFPAAIDLEARQACSKGLPPVASKG